MAGTIDTSDRPGRGVQAGDQAERDESDQLGLPAIVLHLHVPQSSPDMRKHADARTLSAEIF